MGEGANDNEGILFWTEHGRPVPALTTAQMREVDRIAVEEYGLGILQMMENAGRNLALQAMAMLGRAAGAVAILAGAGGNGGGGLCCARHLHNRGFEVDVVLDRAPGDLGGPAADQLRILQAAGLEPVPPDEAAKVIGGADLVVDALIGYSLRGAPRGRAAELIELANRSAARVLALDVPSGLDATTGDTPGAVVAPDRTLTLALPKAGLGLSPAAQRVPGDLYLADIGIPPGVYSRLGLSVEPWWGDAYWIRLEREPA
jgi:NAD(P)H-hydrate epimerase